MTNRMRTILGLVAISVTTRQVTGNRHAAAIGRRAAEALFERQLPPPAPTRSRSAAS